MITRVIGSLMDLPVETALPGRHPLDVVTHAPLNNPERATRARQDNLEPPGTLAEGVRPRLSSSGRGALGSETEISLDRQRGPSPRARKTPSAPAAALPSPPGNPVAYAGSEPMPGGAERAVAGFGFVLGCPA